MPRRKSKPEELLSRPIAIRLTQQEYRRLEDIRRKSDCRSIGELTRRILARRPIQLFHRDASLDGPMEELAGIRQELRFIGTNINQLTRYFHASSRESRKIFLAHQALVQYAGIEAKVNLLLSLISQLAKRW